MSTDPTPKTQQLPVPEATPRVVIGEAKRRSVEVSDGFHRDARSFRNRLTITTVILLIVAVALVLLQWRLPKTSIIEPLTASPHLSRWAVVMLVMVFGSVGALVTAIPAIAAIP